MNRLCEKLAKGDGNIAGMKMLLPMKETALAEVKVVGIAFGHWSRDGVAITVEPIHGAGVAIVGAMELCNNTQAARDLYFRKATAVAFARKNELRNKSDRNWRRLILRERGVLTEQHRNSFDKEAEKLLKGSTIAKATAWELEPVWKLLITVKFDLKDELPSEVC